MSLIAAGVHRHLRIEPFNAPIVSARVNGKKFSRGAFNPLEIITMLILLEYILFFGVDQIFLSRRGVLSEGINYRAEVFVPFNNSLD